MRYIQGKHVLVVVGFLILAIAAGTVIELRDIWRGGYSLLYMNTDNANLATRAIDRAVAIFNTKILANQDKGLPYVRLYISKKAQANLLEDLPNRLRDWQSAHMIYPDGKLRKIKVRHRGGNPFNWLYTAKSWRVKTKKDRMIGNIRKFNYVKIQEPEYITPILSFDIHNRLGLITHNARLVELFVNDVSSGIYLEVEYLEETFLRNNNLMPANIYKGEQYNEERAYGQEHDLFNNPALWKKVAVFNPQPEDDYSDLTRLLSLLKKAETDEAAFAKLSRIVRFKDWGGFSAFQTLVQSWHNDATHNMRLISDPWKGNVLPLIYDTAAMYYKSARCVDEKACKFRLDRGSNALMDLYSKSSVFLWAKHQILSRAIKDEMLIKTADDMKSQLAAVERSAERDPGRALVTKTPGMDDLKVMHRMTLERMRTLHYEIAEILHAAPTANWTAEGRVLTLTVGGGAPISAVHLDGAKTTDEIYWDRDGDGEISDGDVKLPVKDGTIQAIFYANRDGRRGDITPAAFRLLLNSAASVSGVSAVNPLSMARATIKQDDATGRTPGPHNVPVIAKPAPAPLFLSGEQIIRSTRVFDRPVTIAPGTTFAMAANVSLVFRDRVEVLGVKEAPVMVSPLEPSQPWGVFAISGFQTAKSTVSHLKLSGGSGDIVDGVYYSAMLSVHETNDVQFDNLTLSDNSKFDDMMHVIYSNDVSIRDSLFQRSFSDALDVDISTIRINNLRVKQAGNDAIDLMETTAVVVSSSLTTSGDKGVSVGEGSNATVYDTLLKNNAIGIEVKDASQAIIAHSAFIDNDIQLNAKSKNWRYSSGGTVRVDKSIITAERSVISAAKGSTIAINDSSVRPLTVKGGKKVSLTNSDCALAPCAKDYDENVAEALAVSGLPLYPETRGQLH